MNYTKRNNGARNMRLGKFAALTIVCAVGASACTTNLDLKNPNAPTEESVLSDVNGVIALAVGMQSQFANAIIDYMVPNSLVTDEWGTTAKSLLSYQSLLIGGSIIDPTFAVISAPYARTFQIAKSAKNVIAAAPTVGVSPAFQAGLTSLAKLYRAMSLGMLAQQFSSLPLDQTATGGVLHPRTEAYDTVIALLESARADLLNVSEADLAPFKARVLPTTFDLRNTIEAMLARYYLFRGQYQKASDAANRVNTNALSLLSYPSPNKNPIWDLSSSASAGYVGGLNSFVKQAEPADKRPGYWLDLTKAPSGGNPPDTLWLPLRKYAGQNDPFPLYLPDEIKLIKAEASVRLGDLATARTLINQVRTQATSTLDEPVAGLTALDPAVFNTADALLKQIAYERRYELYMQGMRWEDTRRLPQPVNNTVTLQFLPIPTQECQANPNAKVDPSCGGK
jgi:hypothetical protein